MEAPQVGERRLDALARGVLGEALAQRLDGDGARLLVRFAQPRRLVEVGEGLAQRPLARAAAARSFAF